MFRRILLAAVAALGSLASAQATPTQNGYFLNLDTIDIVECPIEGGPAGFGDRGTGTIIGPNRVLTAAHVVEGHTACTFRGAQGHVSYRNTTDDIAILTVSLPGAPVTQITCDGLQDGQQYIEIGFAHGVDKAMNIIEMTGEHNKMERSKVFDHEVKPFDLAKGWSMPGMSGGPVLDMSGHIAGIINAADSHYTLSRSLSDTELCTALRDDVVLSKQPAINLSAGLPSIDDLLKGIK